MTQGVINLYSNAVLKKESSGSKSKNNNFAAGGVNVNRIGDIFKEI